ncbi:MAG: tetratricopeptide repeat protein [Thermoanaerobacteraceae bacterium]|nr:tetratricopeptide repeat protein [Thermoanaerobacteraceae bacterium]
MAFSYGAHRKRRQRMVFIVLTVFLSLGLLGTSIGWLFDRPSSAPPAGTVPPAPDQLIADLESRAKANPNDAAIAAQLARAYQDAGKIEQAVQAYQKALQLDPSSSEIRVNLALDQFLLGQYDQAADNLKEEISRNPGNALAHYYYGQVLALGKGDYRKGIEELQKYVDLAKDGDDVAKAKQMIQEWQAHLKKQ